MSKWTYPMPVYVTRANADGMIGSFTMSAWMVLLTMLLVWLNVIGWSIYGIVNLIGHVI